MRRYSKGILILLAILLGFNAQAQVDKVGFFEPSPTLNKKRRNAVIITESVGYVGTMAGLYKLWYEPYLGAEFHLFNDNEQWLQMDKVGHTATAYYVGLAGIEVQRWAGVEDRKAIWYGGMLGLAFQTSLEIFDGFSSAWGFSTGDAIANTAGTGLLIGQELAWKEQRLKLKFSTQRTQFAAYRPEVLGRTFSERILKDYNGQTYWLSGNIRSFFPRAERIPKWLNLAVGYGADGMTGGSQNYSINAAGEPIPSFLRQRQYYLSLDIDLTKVNTKNGFLRTVFKTIGFLKVPAPALEWNAGSGVMKFRPFYF